MDFDKNYVGKVVRMEYSWYGRPQNLVGYVFEQKPSGKYFDFSICLTDGRDTTLRFTPDSDLKVSSVRMDKDLREALKVLGEAKTAYNTFQDRYQQEKRMHETRIQSARNAVQGLSKDLSIQDMMAEVGKLFQERFPSKGGWQRELYFECNSGSSKDVTVTQIQDVMKYATPEQYPFIYREYDGCLFLNTDCKAYKDFCNRNAPDVIPALKGFKNSADASLGDKNWLRVGRSYTIPLKYGLTKDSLQYIKDVLDGKTRIAPAPAKSSLDSKIKSAAGRAEKAASGKTPGKTDKVR